MVERSSEIEQAVHDIIDAMARSDLDAIAQRTSREDYVVGIGTDASEWTEGYDELMQLFGESLPDAELHLHATLDEVEGLQEGDVGWAAGRGTFAVDDRRVGVRWTAVLHREAGFEARACSRRMEPFIARWRAAGAELGGRQPHDAYAVIAPSPRAQTPARQCSRRRGRR